MLIVATTAAATDVYVDAARGSDAADGLSWATAKATMGAAVATAVATPEPDVLRVAEGTYVEQLRWTAHGISLLGGFPSGGGDPDPGLHPTVILGRGQEYLVSSWGRSPCAVDGFTFTGEVEGSLLSLACSDLQLTRCVFSERRSSVAAPAVTVGTLNGGSAAVTVEDCRFFGNAAPTTEPRAFLGTALRVGDASWVTIRRCSFDRNSSTQFPWYSDFEIGSLLAAVTVEDVTTDSAYMPIGGMRASNVLCRKRLCVGGTIGFPTEYVNVTAGQVIDMSDIGRSLLRDSIVTGIVDGQRVPAIIAESGTPLVDAENCIIAGGWPGTNVLDVDPLLVSGPQGDHYLAHAETGQPVTSPAVDAGGRTAVEAGVDDATTRIDGVLDSGVVDMGYHFPPTLRLTIRRGATPNGLSAHATTDRLPWTDAPGIASDASLNPLFYDIPEAANEIFVQRDLATDSLTLTWR